MADHLPSTNESSKSPLNIKQFLSQASDQFRHREDRLTDKQLSYLQGLILTLQTQQTDQLDTDQSIINSHKEQLEIVERLLNREVPSLDCLNKDDMALLVRQLTDEIKVTASQAIMLRETMSLKQISERLKKEVKSYLDLSVRDFRFLMKSPSRFYLIPLERPIITNLDWEYGYQYSELCAEKKMYYIKFYQMLILDYDTRPCGPEQTLNYDQILKKLEPVLADAAFAIYKTHAGFHVHLLSKPMPHEDEDTYQVMKSFECDPFYALFSHKFGFKIRLSKKLGRQEDFLLKFVSIVGNTQLIDPYLQEMLMVHDYYVQQHS